MQPADYSCQKAAVQIFMTVQVLTNPVEVLATQVVPTLLVAEILMVLLGAKTNDSVELAVTALRESGALLQDSEPQMLRM